VASTDTRQPFDHAAGEPAKAYHAFCHYRDLGPVRSLDRAWREHHEKCLHQVQPETRRRPMSWGNWSARWGWPQRAESYDVHLERQKRDAFRQEQIDASRRHARAIQAAIAASTASIRIALETAATPAGLATLRTAAGTDAASLRVALAEARHAAVTLPALVQAERLVLGMPTDLHQVTDTSPMSDPVAAAIVRSPAALDAACELLDMVTAADAAMENT
jgi:hypothetical protein